MSCTPRRLNTQPYLTIFPAGCRGTAPSTHCRTPKEETINALHLAPPRLSRLRWQWEEHPQLSAGSNYSILFKPTPSEKKKVHCDCLWLLSLLVFSPFSFSFNDRKLSSREISPPGYSWQEGSSERGVKQPPPQVSVGTKPAKSHGFVQPS